MVYITENYIRLFHKAQTLMRRHRLWRPGKVIAWSRDSPLHTNGHFLADTTKEENWLVLVGRPSLAAYRWRARRPAPPSCFHNYVPAKKINILDDHADITKSEFNHLKRCYSMAKFL
jgi:hypothetical protein